MIDDLIQRQTAWLAKVATRIRKRVRLEATTYTSPFGFKPLGEELVVKVEDGNEHARLANDHSFPPAINTYGFMRLGVAVMSLRPHQQKCPKSATYNSARVPSVYYLHSQTYSLV